MTKRAQLCCVWLACMAVASAQTPGSLGSLFGSGLATGLAAADTVSVSFNDFQNASSNPQVGSLSSGGLNFADSKGCPSQVCFSIVGNPAGAPFSGLGVTPVSNGSVVLLASSQNGRSVIVTSPGTTFSMSTIDLNRAFTQDAGVIAGLGLAPNATTINAVGTLAGGGTVVTTFALNGGTGFQTFVFPAGWQNLVSVLFTANNDGSAGAVATANAQFAMDNIVYSLGQAFSCSYSLPVNDQAFGAGASASSVAVSATAGCPWTSSGAPFWVHVTSDSGLGNGNFSFSVDANPGDARSATITVAGLPFTVEQQAAAITGLNFVGAMAHLAAQENWTTAFTLVNKGGASAVARFSTFGDAVDPTGNGPLALQLTIPQAGGGSLLASSFDRTLAANASLTVNTAGPAIPPVLVGSAQLAATGQVDGFAIFHQIPTQQEAVVPMETRTASSYLLAFDNTGGLVLGVAVENISAANAVIPVVIRDENGVLISAPGDNIQLGGNGHTAFVLSIQFPVTAGKRGTIEFDTPAGGRISVLGLRFTPPNNALTTIPALANVGTGGGSIAHLASGGDGWQTTFVLVNTGTSSAQFTLSFFADQTGAPLSLPLAFPQSGSGTVTQNSVVTQTLAAGGTLTIQSTGAPDLLTGSAQLTTTGHVSGFVIFRHNGQEAVVPLESRNASGYVIAFDNTSGTATGVALNAVSAQPVNVPVVVRNEAGVQIATDTITLAANGHYAFTLVFDRYPATANIRGTIEFDTPAGAQIGALGIRIPNVAAHTYTTLPALAK